MVHVHGRAVSEQVESVRSVGLERRLPVEVGKSSDGGFHFHTGRPLAALLGYDPALVDPLPDRAVESFAGSPTRSRWPRWARATTSWTSAPAAVSTASLPDNWSTPTATCWAWT